MFIDAHHGFIFTIRISIGEKYFQEIFKNEKLKKQIKLWIKISNEREAIILTLKGKCQNFVNRLPTSNESFLSESNISNASI